ncbi:aminotransferase [Nonomuraea jiangxiensis]|uniref:Aminotransferase n=1 Tax=Nonomuraea jiangxiensis TaxID=633440 RepID=A0A1G9JUK0_9ACTN|nr:aminotransferase [Nonomuraea jiangxiensis]SDL40824.1 Aspartate/methionine/tyrosine aminotransferase [Nonomuraea jiangxiensis]
MKIAPFGVEQWMNTYETRCTHNLAETCVESLTVAQLLDLAGHGDSMPRELLPLRLAYGAIEGSERLRSAVAALYDRQAAGNVMIAHGGVGANHLVHLTLVEPGDRVVSVLPTYQQHYSIPESIGADVRILPLREENGWLPDLEELAALVEGGAKLVAVNNPNNPTGSLMDRAFLEQVVRICDRAGAWLLCDEVYRGIDQADPGTTVSVADLYERGISTGSMSKAFSLAGLRLGWAVGPASLIDELTVHRDYSTISVGVVDDLLAAIALENAPAILGRNRAITRANLATLSGWVEAQPGISWVRPRGGTTALLRHELPVPSRELCVQLLEETGVMLTPGSAMSMEGYLRIGYANNPAVLAAGLPLLGEFLDSR